MTQKPNLTASSNPHVAQDLAASSKLVVQAVQAVTDIVEGMHRNIASISPLVRSAASPRPLARTKGITGLVYSSVRGVTSLVGKGLELVLSLKPLEKLLSRSQPLPQRAALLSALNGVLGDHLVQTGNALAIAMHFRQNGAPLDVEGQTNGKLLILIHGLCMNDEQWLHGADNEKNIPAHDHGAALARDLGYLPIYLRYNTGLSIASNGLELAQKLEELVNTWPVPVTQLCLLCHSMGGLVARSACLQAAPKSAWIRLLQHMVFLGTPHHGAPLERAGSMVDYALGVSPYSAPLRRLGLVRSQGIKDLRHGKVRPAGKRLDAFALPTQVRCHAVAATVQKPPERLQQGALPKRLLGDGLVPVASALGQHQQAERSLNIPIARQLLVYQTDHFALLSSPVVYQYLRQVL